MNIFAAIAIFGGYALYVWGRIPEGELPIEEQLQFWAKMMLLLIPFSIGGRLVAHILWAIGYRIVAGENIPSREDERDKMIELKAMARSQWIFILSFFLGLGFIAMLKPISLLFVTLAIGGLLSDVFSEAVRLYFYRRGF
ncbi:MAG: hypothetical protein AAFQ98_14780 [Bacteroidota bacterium]